MVGFGNVGRSLVKIIQQSLPSLKRQYGAFDPKFVAICELKGTLVNKNGLDLDAIISSNDITTHSDWIADKKTLDILKDIEADIMIECAWTNSDTGEPALSHVLTALKNKKHVVSSNKGPFYLEYNKISALAKKNDLILGIESTVGSAIPALQAKDSLSGTEITSIRAILNGTSNYILSRMTSENLSFDLALKEAQDLGYAEADPTLDIEGYDAAGKMVILANELLGWDKTMKDVSVEGITGITAHAIELAKEDGYLIKHVGIAKDNTLSVGPQLVHKNSTLAVNGSLNVVEFSTEHGGPITLIGRGAGGPEAAAGILSNIIQISRERSL